MGHGVGFQDLTGAVFGRLEVVRLYSKGGGHTRWWCRCRCGREKAVLAHHLKSRRSPSCGCAIRRNCYPVQVTLGQHGKTNTPEHRIWCGMLQRCFDPSSSSYQRYGGRGITVCDGWLNFDAFLKDMGVCPSSLYSLDRFPNIDGNYEPSNCRWATAKEQNRNRRDNRILTHNGQSLTLAEWSEVTGLERSTIANRINKLGWSVSKSLTTGLFDSVRRLTQQQIEESRQRHVAGESYETIARSLGVGTMTLWQNINGRSRVSKMKVVKP